MMNDEIIQTEKWYSISDLVELAKAGLLPYKARQTWLELISTGKLAAIVKGDEKRKTYSIQGKDILANLDASKTQVV